jgi:hypothetical protein
MEEAEGEDWQRIETGIRGVVDVNRSVFNDASDPV